MRAEITTSGYWRSGRARRYFCQVSGFDDDDEGLQRALAQAEQIRTHRDQTITQIRLGSMSLAELFELSAIDSQLQTIKAVVLLEAVPGVGKVAARKALTNAGLSENIRIGSLDGDAKKTLLEALSRS